MAVDLSKLDAILQRIDAAEKAQGGRYLYVDPEAYAAMIRRIDADSRKPGAPTWMIALRIQHNAQAAMFQFSRERAPKP